MLVTALYRFSTAINAQFPKEVVNVVLDGVKGDVESLSDVLVAHAACDKLENLSLARCQPRLSVLLMIPESLGQPGQTLGDAGVDSRRAGKAALPDRLGDEPGVSLRRAQRLLADGSEPQENRRVIEWSRDSVPAGARNGASAGRAGDPSPSPIPVRPTLLSTGRSKEFCA